MFIRNAILLNGLFHFCLPVSPVATEDAIKRLPLLEDLRDEIIANYEKRHSKPPIGAMCENDLDLLKQWHWDR